MVAADGIHSTLRAGPPPRPTGLVAWRFLATGVPDHEWTAWQDRDRTFLAISLGGGHAYCYADASHAATGDWRDLFADFPDPVPALARQGSGAHHAPIEQVGPAYSDDPRTVLIGDAAHAFSLNMAQGAALAFEDALVLADLIEKDDLGSYRDRRQPRVTWVRDQTRAATGPGTCRRCFGTRCCAWPAHASSKRSSARSAVACDPGLGRCLRRAVGGGPGVAVGAGGSRAARHGGVSDRSG